MKPEEKEKFEECWCKECRIDVAKAIFKDLEKEFIISERERIELTIEQQDKEEREIFNAGIKYGKELAFNDIKELKKKWCGE